MRYFRFTFIAVFFITISAGLAQADTSSPSKESAAHGLTISCELSAPGIKTVATQTEYLQQSCFYGQCSDAGYGFLWYFTKQSFASPKSPKIEFITQEFAKSPGLADSKVVIAFNASQAFFDYAEESLQGIDVLNAEAREINSQDIKTTLGDLAAGIDQKIKVGVLAEDYSVTYAVADLHCIAK